MKMFVYFGAGKCPVCGNFGKTVKSDVFHCSSCDILFNEFSIAGFMEEPEERECN